MAQRRSAKLYFSTHRDCFIHGLPKEWTAWLKPSLDQLYLVRLVFPGGFCLVASFSSRPALPSNMRRANVLSSEEYLEIDTEYAKCLNIKEGEQVMVECIPDLTVCKKMSAAPTDENCYEILDCNREKIEYDLMTQVRVISACFPFPIWINNQPIFLKLKSSDPPAKWVLLAKNTFVDLSIASTEQSTNSSTAMTPISPPPYRSESSLSEDSNQSYISSVSHQQPSLPKLPLDQSDNSQIMRRHSKSDASISTMASQGFACFTNDEMDYYNMEETEGEEEDEGMVSKLMNSIGMLFQRNKSPDSDIISTTTSDPSQGLLHPQDATKSAFSRRPLSPSKSFTSGVSGHVKQHSWSGRSEFERAKSNPGYPPIASLPMKLVLRIQKLEASSMPRVWGTDNMSDIYVHPLSVPHHYQLNRATGTTFLVRMSLLNPLPVAETEREKPPVSSDSHAPTPNSTISSANSFNGKSFLTRLASYVTEPPERNTPSPTPPTSTPPSIDKLPTYYCQQVLVHMHMVSSVVERKKPPVSSGAIEEVSVSREGSSSPTHGSPSAKQLEIFSRQLNRIPVLPGHVLMSDFVRRQLGAENNSFVVLREVKSDWRVDCRQNRPIIILEPLEPSPVRDLPERSDLINGFRQIVTACKENKFGYFFTDKAIMSMPLKGKSSNSSNYSMLFRVKCKIGTPIVPLKESPLRIYQFYPVDLKFDLIRLDMRKDRVATLIPLKESQTDDENIGMEQFGAIEQLFANCYSYLMLTFSQERYSALLICGTGGGGGGVGVTSGCGKTSLATLLCKAVSRSLWQFHVIKVDCTLLRGRRLESIRKRVTQILKDVNDHEPAVILLDDLDEVARHITDAQKEASGEALANTKNAQIILDFLTQVRLSKAIVIATSSSKQSLHPSLLQYKGRHLFYITEIKPPNLTQRQEMLQALLRNCPLQSALSPDDLRAITLRTEGFQAKDLSVLVDRAISSAEQRAVHIVNTRPLADRSLSTLGLVQHSQTPYKKDSVATVVPNMKRGSSLYPAVVLGREDFWSALDSYMPAALKGLSLHSRGKINFEKVGGLKEAKRILTETMLWPSKYPKLFKSCPIKQHAGVLLYGAPGTGKTLLAEAVANEFCLNFVSIKGPELLNKYIGASEQAVRDLFSRAQAAQPCILFFDEFDSLAPQRGHDRTGVTDRVVNQLLTELDGVESSQGVYVLAASSRPDLIDPALLRPGRIDKTLFCNVPSDEEERHSILLALSSDLSTDDTVDLQEIAKATIDYTGADLKALLYNAQLLSVNRTLNDNKKDVTIATVTENRTGQSNEELSSSLGGVVNEQSQLLSMNQTGTNSTERKVWQFQNESGGEVIQTLLSFKQQSPIQRLMNQSSQNKFIEKRKSPLCFVTQADLEIALKETKPSLPKREKLKYEKIYEKFQRGGGLAEQPNQRATLA